MIYLSSFINTDREGIFRVGYKHFYPLDKNNGLHKTKEELEKEGIFIDSLPIKLKEKERYNQELFYNKVENKVFYDYIELEKEKNNTLLELEELKKENLELKLALAEHTEKNLQEVTELKLALAEITENNLK